MIKEILTFKQNDGFAKSFLILYFVSLVWLIPNCAIIGYLPSPTSTFYGYWTLTGQVSGLGIGFLVLNTFLVLGMISLWIARVVKKPWLGSLEAKQQYDKQVNTYLKFDWPVITCIWIMTIIGLINKPGLITFNVYQTYSFLFQTLTSYFDGGAIVTFILIAMAWVGIITQISQDLLSYLKQKKYSSPHVTEHHEY